MRVLPLIATLLLMCAASARADITWTFNNVTFCLHCTMPSETDNDITSTSWFTTDNTATTVTGWDITVEGTNLGADNEYTSSVPGNGYIFPDPNNLAFFSPGFVQYLDFFFAGSGLTGSGGTVDLLQGDLGLDFNSTIACNGCSTLVAGSVTGTPEPRYTALALFGIAALGLMARWKFVRA